MDVKPEELRLRKADKNDAHLLANLRLDPEVAKNLHNPKIYSVEDCKKWLSNMGPESERLVVYREIERERPKLTYDMAMPWPELEDCFVGVARIDQIDQTNRNCYIGLDIQKVYRGKGLARPAYELIFDYLFNKRNMETLYLEFIEYPSPPSFHRKLYEGLDFKEAGKFYNKIKRGNKTYNSVLMYLKREKWLEILALRR